MLKGRKRSKPQDELTLEMDNDRRRYFRIKTDPDRPVFFQEDSGARFHVTDICAGGLAMKTGPFFPEQEYQGRLILPGAEASKGITLVAVRPVEEETIGAEIASISEEDRDLLHAYVLQRQKEELKKARA